MPTISFDRAAEYYDATRALAPGVAERIRHAILAFTGLKTPARILEFGAGTGRIALPFIAAGDDYTGVDVSRAMLARLQAKAGALAAGGRCALVQADVTRPLPFAGEAFDVVLGVHVFHLLAEWRPALREALRVLRKPRGRLLIAGDERPAEEAHDTDPFQMVHARWDDILRGLGHERDDFKPGVRADEGSLAAYLHELGAHTQAVDLLEHEFPPLSLRQMAERHKARVYTSDWRIPDEIQAQAAAQLDRWLETEAVDPDRAVVRRGVFHALAARRDTPPP